MSSLSTTEIEYLTNLQVGDLFALKFRGKSDCETFAFFGVEHGYVYVKFPNDTNKALSPIYRFEQRAVASVGPIGSI